MNWDGKFYNKNSSSQMKRAQMVLEEITFNGNESVLDIGCGDGKISFEIAGKVNTGGSVLGIDSSQSMIDFSKRYEKKASNLKFQCIGGDEFFLDGGFDLIVSFNALHWIKDQEKVFKNIERSLKSGGKFRCVMTSDKTNFMGVSRAMNILESEEKWLPFLQGQETLCFPGNIDKYEEMLKRNGLVIKKLRETCDETIFENYKNFSGWLMGWLTSCKNLPNRRKYLEFVKDISKNIKRLSDGKLLVETGKLDILCVKP